jgi:hypothetical protein
MFGYEMVFPMFLVILLLSAILGGLLGAAVAFGYFQLRRLWAGPVSREQARAMAVRGSVIGVFVGLVSIILLIGFNLALHFA